MSGRVHLSEDRIPGRPLIAAAVVVVVFSLLLSGWAWLIHARKDRELAPGPHPAPVEVGRTLSEVRQTLILEERPGQVLFRMQRDRLESFGWVDREAGVVHIPIEAAMDQVAGQGGP